MKKMVFRKISTLFLSMVMTVSLVTPALADDLITEDIVSNDVLTEDTADVLSYAADDLITEDTLIEESEETVTETVDNLTAASDSMDTEINERMQYILDNDPGIIWMPIEEDVDENYVEDNEPVYTQNDSDGPITCILGGDIHNDKVSQTQYGYSWPETQLTDEERAFVIRRVKEIVAEVITDDMSDIEKYWTLNKWVMENVKYKNDTSRTFAHDTPHGSYSALKYGSCVCQGYALLYSHLCHAAGLPCDEIASKQEYNHMINYIPNINGNSYYLDVAGIFLASDASRSTAAGSITLYGDFVNKNGKNITCSNNSFTEYGRSIYWPIDYSLAGTAKTYDIFYHTCIVRDYQDPVYKYNLAEPYVEKGSGIRGQHYAHYADYALQESQNTGDWELDDFYVNPKAHQKTSQPAQPTYKKIEDTAVSGLKSSYDCTDKAAYLDALKKDIVLTYNNTRLALGTDYNMETITIGDTKGWVKIVGWGNYTGFKEVEFTIKKTVQPTPDPAPSPTPVPGPTPEPLPSNPEPSTGPKEPTTVEKSDVSLDVAVTEDVTVKRYDMITSFTGVKCSVKDNSIAAMVTLKDNSGYAIAIRGKKAGNTTATVETDDTVYSLNITVNEPERDKINT